MEDFERRLDELERENEGLRTALRVIQATAAVGLNLSPPDTQLGESAAPGR